MHYTHEQQTALSALHWLQEMGLQEMSCETPPTDQKAHRISAIQSSQKQIREEPTSTAPLIPDKLGTANPPRRRDPMGLSEAISAAIQQAQSCQSLQDIVQKLNVFSGCSLRETAMNLCLYKGFEKADFVIVGEAPSKDEDRKGEPFAGSNGRLLIQMLEAAQFNCDKILFTNHLFWRPPGDRSPTDGEIEICKPFLLKLLEITHPKLIITCGGGPTKTLIGQKKGILNVRGTWQKLALSEDSEALPLMPILRPEYLLNNPLARRFSWRDILTLRHHCIDHKIDCF